MHPQLGLSVEGGGAVAARVEKLLFLSPVLLLLSSCLSGILALVKQCVLPERAGLREATPAALAHVQSLANIGGGVGAVTVPVAAQVALVGKGLGAEVTAVRLVVRVTLQVSTQVTPALEGLATVWARLHITRWTTIGERRGCGVNSHGTELGARRGVPL